MAESLRRGLTAAGADVLDIGLGGTEQVYFSAFHYDVDGGIMVTASHNPEDYNGMKLVGKGSRPISSDNGLLEIKALMTEHLPDAPESGTVRAKDCMPDFVKHLLGYVNQGNSIRSPS